MLRFKASEFFGNGTVPWSRALYSQVRSATLMQDLQVSLVSFDAEECFELTAVDDKDAIHFSYLFDGNVEATCGSQAMTLKAGTLLTSYAPQSHFTLRISPQYRNVELMIRPRLLEELAGEEYEQLSERIRSGFCLHDNGCDAQACQAATMLAQLLATPGTSPLLVQAAAMEFLAWQLRLYNQGNRIPAIPARERRQLELAHEWLLKDLSSPPTISELARQVGLNQLKLKRGFKLLFGDSIYALFLKKRMQRARELLQEQSVTETAVQLGYSNVSHFSACFRKHYGVLPREVRRSSRFI